MYLYVQPLTTLMCRLGGNLFVVDMLKVVLMIVICVWSKMVYSPVIYPACTALSCIALVGCRFCVQMAKGLCQMTVLYTFL